MALTLLFWLLEMTLGPWRPVHMPTLLKTESIRAVTGASLENGIFRFWIELPLALGTVGGLTKLHPLAKLSMEILQNPDADELMKIVAVAGLAQNFAALKALTTTGIQQGHMKMHLMNILNQLEANVHEKEIIVKAFNQKTVSHRAVAEYLHILRTGHS